MHARNLVRLLELLNGWCQQGQYRPTSLKPAGGRRQVARTCTAYQIRPVKNIRVKGMWKLRCLFLFDIGGTLSTIYAYSCLPRPLLPITDSSIPRWWQLATSGLDVTGGALTICFATSATDGFQTHLSDAASSALSWPRSIHLTRPNRARYILDYLPPTWLPGFVSYLLAPLLPLELRFPPSRSRSGLTNLVRGWQFLPRSIIDVVQSIRAEDRMLRIA